MPHDWKLQFHRSLFRGTWEIRQIRWTQEGAVSGSEIVGVWPMPVTWIAREHFEIDA